MNHFDVIQSFLELCDTSASSTDSIAAGFAKAVNGLGFRHFACFSHVDPLNPPGHAILVHNYPAAWFHHYSEQKFYRIDPVFRRAQGSASPFFWDETLRTTTMTKAEKRVLAEATTFGLAHGYTLPIKSSWLPGSLRASCSVVPDSQNLETGSYATLKVLAHFLYVSMATACTPATGAPFPELTSRERQCLVLVAQGKDEWTIARILGLSPATVHYHIGRLKRRFQVATGPQAVFSAVMTGQLSYCDVHRRVDSNRVDAEIRRNPDTASPDPLAVR
ncbi:MAG TPA: LuxR family transcriptional regulator [Terriglobales bacterium]|nr:LuxR family transcriptional regulator [Terriglobales bacterium]